MRMSIRSSIARNRLSMFYLLAIRLEVPSAAADLLAVLFTRIEVEVRNRELVVLLCFVRLVRLVGVLGSYCDDPQSQERVIGDARRR
jgi:hypothetical protein